jgi:hypothetical protein
MAAFCRGSRAVVEVAAPIAARQPSPARGPRRCPRAPCLPCGQAQNDLFLALPRFAEVRVQAHEQRRVGGDELLAVAVEVRPHLVAPGLGLAQHELLRPVAGGEVSRHQPALMGTGWAK